MEEALGWGDGTVEPQIAGAQIFSGRTWTPRAAAAKNSSRPDDDAPLYVAGMETVHGALPGEDNDVSVRRTNIAMIVAILILLAFFQLTPPDKLSNFYARKLTHMSMGACLLISQPVGHPFMKLTILAVGVFSILSCFVMPFRFSEKADKGIIIFNIIVCVWVLLNLPLSALAPMFFADPAGAITGRLLKTPRWYRNKTVAGSLAVFLVTFVTAFTAPSLAHRFILATTCCLLEAVGGDYDNALMSVPLIVHFFAFQYPSSSVVDLPR